METFGKEESIELGGWLCWEKRQKGETRRMDGKGCWEMQCLENNRVRECNLRDQSRSRGPNMGSQSEKNSGQDDLSNSGSVSLAPSGILPAAISEEIGFPDFLNEPSCWAGTQHT